MNLTVLQLFVAAPVLQKLVGQEMPIRASFQVARLVNRVQAELQVAEESRAAIVRKYAGDPDENQTLHVHPEKMSEFSDEFNMLCSTQINVDWSPLTVDMLDNAQLTPADLLAMGPMVEGGDGPP